MLVVTTAEITGYRIDAVLGDVIGYGYAYQMGMSPQPIELMMRSRDQAVQGMWMQATQRGANAVVGHQLLAMGEGAIRVYAIGTAVAVVPIAQGQPGATPQSIEDARQRDNSQRNNAQPMPGQYTQPPQVQFGPQPGVQSMPSAGYPQY